LYCDDSVPFGTVASIVDALKAAGTRHVAIRYEQAR
jgi:biopolymer transport protein ExbD